jgi:hypothetical protein
MVSEESLERLSFKTYEEYRDYILKCLKNIEMECLNLEIQVVQIEDDAAVRGSKRQLNLYGKI